MIHKTLPFIQVEKEIYVCCPPCNKSNLNTIFNLLPIYYEIIFSAVLQKVKLRAGWDHMSIQTDIKATTLDKHGTRQKASDNVCVQYAL